MSLAKIKATQLGCTWTYDPWYFWILPRTLTGEDFFWAYEIYSSYFKLWRDGLSLVKC